MVGGRFSLRKFFGLEPKPPSAEIFSKTFEKFQGLSLEYLRDIRNLLSHAPINRSGIIKLNEELYPRYADFTAKEAIFRAASPDVYKQYRLFIRQFGMIYTTINDYATGKFVDSNHLFDVVDKGIKVIVKIHLPSSKVSSPEALQAAAK